MYLSSLLIDTGNNPDRERPARQWLRNLYRVHQRLSMAFPSGDAQAADPHFLQPYNPNAFTQELEHDKNLTRSRERGFLFRVDVRSDGPAVILVQSAIIPDWEYAFQNTGFLGARPEWRAYDPEFEAGAELRFRLLANPTKKVDSATKAERTDAELGGTLSRKRLDGRRVPVADDQLGAWLERHGSTAGFRVLQIDSLVPGYVLARKGADNAKGAGARLRSARYDGVLAVEDPAVFREAILRGIGPAKAFGFGLLSVARAARNREA